MRETKTLPIDRFVEYILYNNQEGYYSTKNPFGKSGDFITAPGISFLFSEMIAIWTISFWESLGKPKRFNIVELGPGDGKLCNILIRTFKKFPSFYKSVNIFLYEKSKFLKNIQKNIINEKNIHWIDNFKKIKKGPILFFGNEFFDSIPIKQFEKKNDKVYEKYLEIKNNFPTKTVLRKASNKIIRELKKYKL